MKVLITGHLYELDSLEGTNPQQLQFIHKARLNPEDPLSLTTIQDGTTNEEVIKALIDRLETMNKQLPNRDTSIAITHLEDALMRLERRTRDRVARGVEGTHKA